LGDWADSDCAIELRPLSGVIVTVAVPVGSNEHADDSLRRVMLMGMQLLACPLHST